MVSEAGWQRRVPAWTLFAVLQVFSSLFKTISFPHFFSVPLFLLRVVGRNLFDILILPLEVCSAFNPNNFRMLTRCSRKVAKLADALGGRPVPLRLAEKLGVEHLVALAALRQHAQGHAGRRQQHQQASHRPAGPRPNSSHQGC